MLADVNRTGDGGCLRGRAGLLLLIAVLAWLCGGLTSQAKPEWVTCPALQILDKSRDRYYPDLGGFPSLIAVGSATELKFDSETEHLVRLEIEEVISGEPHATVVEYAARQSPSPGRAIYFLAPSPSSRLADYDLFLTMPDSMIPEARALCSARITRLALEARSIFVGDEIRVGSGVREIKVRENVAGEKYAINERLRVPAYPATKGESLRPHPGKRLYIVIHPGPLPKHFLPRVEAVLPLNLRSEVLAALQKRDSFPLCDAPSNAYATKYREIFFEGDADEAMRFFQSPNAAAQSLGLQYFLHHVDEGRVRILPLIEAAMLRGELPPTGNFERQKWLIGVLAQIERTSPTDAIGQLVEKMITALEAGPASVPVPAAITARDAVRAQGGPDTFGLEETLVDGNHSLTWLLQNLPEDEVARRWDERLLGLAGRLDGWWQREATLAVDVMRIASNRELNAAVARMKDVKPVRSETRLHNSSGGISAVTCSADGAYLATVSKEDMRVWSMVDWRCLSVVYGGDRKIHFAPDSRFYYFGCGTELDAAFCRYEWAENRADRNYIDPLGMSGQLQLTADGRRALTGIGSSKIQLWDTTSGQKLRVISRLSATMVAAVSDDGKWIARTKLCHQAAGDRGPLPPTSASWLKTGDDHFETFRGADSRNDKFETVIESWDGKRSVLLKGVDHVQQLAFTHDGRHLISVTTAPDDHVCVKLHEITGRNRSLAKITLEGQSANQIVLSPNGKFAAIGVRLGFGTSESKFWLCTLPDLKIVWASKRNVEDIAFSVDGKLMFLASGLAAPEIVQLEDLREITPYEGHPGHIWNVSFSADKRRIWSVGGDGSICRWEAATMKMVDRQPGPEGCLVSSIEFFEQKYALYLEEAPTPGPEPSPPGTGEARQWARFVELETGKVISRMEILKPAAENFYWLPGGRFLVYGFRTIVVGDYLNGKVVHQTTSPEGYEGLGLLSEGRKTLLRKKGSIPHIADSGIWDRIDLESGAITHPTVVKAIWRNRWDASATADGETFSLSPGETTRPKVPAVRGVQILSSGLSPDKRRLLVVTGNSGWGGSAEPTAVRIHDAKSLKMLYAILLPNRWITVDTWSFSPDGTDLAIARSDGTIECWPIPD